jgi:hypothetical protein
MAGDREAGNRQRRILQGGIPSRRRGHDDIVAHAELASLCGIIGVGLQTIGVQERFCHAKDIQ